MHTDDEAPHCAVSSSPLLPHYLIPLRPKYLPQHPILRHPQPTFLPQYETPIFLYFADHASQYFILILTNLMH